VLKCTSSGISLLIVAGVLGAVARNAPYGLTTSLMESRAAFAEKRKPNFKGWNDPEDRYRLPTLSSVR
jgi:hypothetical protein